MVTIVEYQKRQKSETAEEFFVLIVQGGIEMVQSKQTKKFYATAKKCSIPSTFPENVCKGLIGTQMPGKVVKVSCEPYEYTVQETGEVLELSHRWEYLPDEVEGETEGISAENFIKDFSSNVGSLVTESI